MSTNGSSVRRRYLLDRRHELARVLGIVAHAHHVQRHDLTDPLEPQPLAFCTLERPRCSSAGVGDDQGVAGRVEELLLMAVQLGLVPHLDAWSCRCRT